MCCSQSCALIWVHLLPASTLSGTELGAAAIRGALANAGVRADAVDEVYMGMVLQANAGQAPAKQAQLFAGIPDAAPATTVNKVCASGMKACAFGAQNIMLGMSDCVVVGGMESMSNAPYYVDGNALRFGKRLGDSTLVDAMVKVAAPPAPAPSAFNSPAVARAAKPVLRRTG
jgi:acetyl-CoA C-acetyltransferase